MWQWCVSSETETVRGQAVNLLTAARRLEYILTHSAGVAQAQISGPGLSPTRMVAVDGKLRAEGDDGDDG